MTLIPLLLFAVQDDARLAVHASLTQPRVTYAELGAWVQKSTGVPVTVATVIRDRKATVLVEDRPVKEIMDRVAEALLLEWERTKDGYTLRLQPKVAQEETQMIRDEADAWIQGLRDGLASFAKLSRYSPEQLKSETDAALEEYRQAAKDQTPEGKARFAEVSARYSRLSTFYYNKLYQAGGSVLAQMTPSQRDSILDGAPIYASEHPGPGMIRLSTDTADLLKAVGGGPTEGTQRLFSIRYDAGRGEVTMASAARSSGGYGGVSMMLPGNNDPSYTQGLAERPLAKRLRDWQTIDPATMATKITPETEKPVRRQTPYRSLADILVRLHARTGLPIVADGFRTAVSAQHPPEGGTLEAWLKDFTAFDGRYRAPRPLVRTSAGWLMLRQSRYYKQLAREIPESRIRTLEAAAGKSGGASLEEFAVFAGGLTLEQEPWTDPASLVMDAPSQAITGNIPFLRLWNSLPNVYRQTALTPAGLLFSSLQPPQRRLYGYCLKTKFDGAFVSATALPYALPGGPPLPPDLRIFVKARKDVFVMEFTEYVAGETGRGFSSNRDIVPGFEANLGTSTSASLAQYSIPLHPALPPHE